MKKIVFLLMPLFGLLACAEPVKETKALTDIFTKERSLTAIVSPIEGNIGYHQVISSAGDYLLGKPYLRNEYFFSVVDPSTSKSVNLLVPYGRGRNEASDVCMINNRAGEFGFYDSVKKQIRIMSVDDILKPTPEIKFESIELVPKDDFTNDFLDGITRVADGRFVQAGYSPKSDNLIATYDASGKEVSTFGRVDFPKNTHDFAKRTTSGNIAAAMSGGRLLWTTKGGNLYRFYNCSDPNSEPKLIKEYFYNLPKFEIVEQEYGISSSPAPDSPKGVTNIAVGNDKYFLLFTDYVLSKDGMQIESITSKVLVFSKDGEPIEVLNLDKGVQTIAYLEKTNSIYAFYAGEDSDLLLQYKL